MLFFFVLGFQLQLLAAFLSHALSICAHLGLQQFLGTALPGTLAKDFLYVVSKDDLVLYQQLGQLRVSFLVLGQYLLGALVLLVDHLQHLFVYQLGCGL